MKKLYGILKAALGCFLGVFLGMTTYTCWDYRAHPGLYALQSAPWYLSIQIHAVLTIVVCGMLALGIWILRKKCNPVGRPVLRPPRREQNSSL